METLLRKYLWAVDLAVVALCATFLGMAASGAVESKFASAPAPARPALPKPSKPAGKPALNKDPQGHPQAEHLLRNLSAPAQRCLARRIYRLPASKLQFPHVPPIPRFPLPPLVPALPRLTFPAD